MPINHRPDLLAHMAEVRARISARWELSRDVVPNHVQLVAGRAAAGGAWKLVSHKRLLYVIYVYKNNPQSYRV